MHMPDTRAHAHTGALLDFINGITHINLQFAFPHLTIHYGQPSRSTDIVLILKIATGLTCVPPKSWDKGLLAGSLFWRVTPRQRGAGQRGPGRRASGPVLLIRLLVLWEAGASAPQNCLPRGPRPFAAPGAFVLEWPHVPMSVPGVGDRLWAHSRKRAAAEGGSWRLHYKQLVAVATAGARGGLRGSEMTLETRVTAAGVCDVQAPHFLKHTQPTVVRAAPSFYCLLPQCNTERPCPRFLISWCFQVCVPHGGAAGSPHFSCVNSFQGPNSRVPTLSPSFT